MLITARNPGKQPRNPITFRRAGWHTFLCRRCGHVLRMTYATGREPIHCAEDMQAICEGVKGES